MGAARAGIFRHRLAAGGFTAGAAARARRRHARLRRCARLRVAGMLRLALRSSSRRPRPTEASRCISVMRRFSGCSARRIRRAGPGSRSAPAAAIRRSAACAGRARTRSGCRRDERRRHVGGCGAGVGSRPAPGTATVSAASAGSSRPRSTVERQDCAAATAALAAASIARAGGAWRGRGRACGRCARRARRHALLIRRAASGALARRGLRLRTAARCAVLSMPVATTDTRMMPSRLSSKVAPTMMLASWSTSSRMRVAASSTS